MRILCISAQSPIAPAAACTWPKRWPPLAAAGHQVAVIVGIDKDDSPQLAPGVEFPGALPHP